MVTSRRRPDLIHVSAIKIEDIQTITQPTSTITSTRRGTNNARWRPRDLSKRIFDLNTKRRDSGCHKSRNSHRSVSFHSIIIIIAENNATVFKVWAIAIPATNFVSKVDCLRLFFIQVKRVAKQKSDRCSNHPPSDGNTFLVIRSAKILSSLPVTPQSCPVPAPHTARSRWGCSRILTPSSLMLPL